jgi:hypothetical protein
VPDEQMVNPAQQGSLASGQHWSPGIRLQAVYEVLSFTIRTSLYERDILELKVDGGYTTLKRPLNLSSIRAGIGDQPHTQQSRFFLYELKIPYLIPEWSVYPEYVAAKGSLTPSAINIGLL